MEWKGDWNVVVLLVAVDDEVFTLFHKHNYVLVLVSYIQISLYVYMNITICINNCAGGRCFSLSLPHYYAIV